MFKATIINVDIEHIVSAILKRQLPRALANTINNTLGDVRKNTDKRIKKVFDRPVDYMSKHATFQVRAFPFPGKLTGKTGIKDHQATKYLFQERGGYRTARSSGGKYSGQRGSPGGKMIPIPTGIDLDSHGNMSNRAIKRNLRRKDTFQAGDREGVTPGIYRRRRGSSGKIENLVVFKRKARYRPRFQWQDSAAKTAAARAPYHLKRAIVRELANPVFRNRRGQKRF